MELTLQLSRPWIASMLPLLSRDTNNRYTLLFPKLASLNLVGYDWNDNHEVDDVVVRSIYDKRPVKIERAILRFVGETSRPRTLHRHASPIKHLFISGIAISVDCERRLRAKVEHVEVMSASSTFYSFLAHYTTFQTLSKTFCSLPLRFLPSTFRPI